MLVNRSSEGLSLASSLWLCLTHRVTADRPVSARTGLAMWLAARPYPRAARGSMRRFTGTSSTRRWINQWVFSTWAHPRKHAPASGPHSTGCAGSTPSFASCSTLTAKTESRQPRPPRYGNTNKIQIVATHNLFLFAGHKPTRNPKNRTT